MRYYSKEELCVIFGVSMEAIYRWIDEEKFVGISPLNQSQINEHTIWCSSTPESFTVGEVQKMYEKNQERLKGGEEE